MRLSSILLLLAALGLVSCAGRERGPLFLDGQGGAQRARPAGEGRYTLKHAIPLEAAQRAFYLRYRPAAGAGDGSAQLRVLDPSGGVLARRALEDLPAPAGVRASAAVEVSLQVGLPPGSRVAGFAVGAQAGRLPAILEAGLEPPFSGFELAGDRLRLGSGVRGLQLPPGSMEVELGSESYGGERWRIELEYELAGRADWADLRLLEAGLQPARRARARFTAAAGGRRAAFEQDALPGAQRLFLYPATVGFDPARLALRPLDGGHAAVHRLEVVPLPARAEAPAGPVLDPLPADPAAVLLYDPRLWRQPDYELFAWERFPGILILDTADYAAQDRFFKRLAFFVEKQGYRGRLVTGQEMSGLHGYNAHDYRAEDLARFFAAADAQGFALNREEELLRTMLTANGLLRDGGKAGSEAGQGAVLSISRESGELLRALLLTHEAFHGLFFTLPNYRRACEEAWGELEEPERRFWRLFLDWGSYDFHDGYLAANEMQAYLFQQPRSGLNFYFRRLTAGRLERAFPGEAPWLREYLGAGGGGFETVFDRLAPALRREAGLEGGRVLEWRKVQY
jgi:hypothetical protein